MQWPLITRELGLGGWTGRSDMAVDDLLKAGTHFCICNQTILVDTMLQELQPMVGGRGKGNRECSFEYRGS